MRIISFIEEAALIKKILIHLNLWMKYHDPPTMNKTSNHTYIEEYQEEPSYEESQFKYEDEFSQVNPYDDF